MPRTLTVMSAALATVATAGVLPVVVGTFPNPPMLSIPQSSAGASSVPLPPNVLPSIAPVSTADNRLVFRFKDGTEVANTLVRNESDRKQTLTLQIILQDREGNELKASLNQPNGSVVLDAHKVSVLALQVQLHKPALLPASGLIRICSEGFDESGKTVVRYSDAAITIPRLAEPGILYLFVLPLAVAGAIVTITIVRLLLAKVSPLKRMGTAN